MNKNFIYIFTVSLFLSYNIFSKFPVVKSKYEILNAQEIINDIDKSAREFEKIKLLNIGLSREYLKEGTKFLQFINPDLYKNIDVYVADENLNSITNDIIKNGENLINSWQKDIYTKYIYPVVREKEISDGKSAENINPKFIILRKDLLEKERKAYKDIYIKNSNFLNSIKLKFENLKSENNNRETPIYRYSESLRVVNSLINFFEKVLNKLSNIDEQLQANYDNRK